MKRKRKGGWPVKVEHKGKVVVEKRREVKRGVSREKKKLLVETVGWQAHAWGGNKNRARRVIWGVTMRGNEYTKEQRESWTSMNKNRGVRRDRRADIVCVGRAMDRRKWHH